MLIQNSRSTTGIFAGVIAMMIALTAMELISWIIAPARMVSELLNYMLLWDTYDLTSGLIDFLFTENVRLIFTAILLVLFLAAAGFLGNWTAEVWNDRARRAMQSGAILLLVTFTWMFLSERHWFDHYLLETLLSLVVPFFIFAVVLSRLLAPAATQKHWQIAGLVAAIGLILIVYEVTEHPYW